MTATFTKRDSRRSALEKNVQPIKRWERAILLAAFESDKRSHLDLQIDLLAEREMTAVLQVLQDIARHLEGQTTVTPEQLRDLMKKKTDLRRLTNRMEELAEPATCADASSAAAT